MAVSKARKGEGLGFTIFVDSNLQWVIRTAGVGTVRGGLDNAFRMYYKNIGKIFIKLITFILPFVFYR